MYDDELDGGGHVVYAVQELDGAGRVWVIVDNWDRSYVSGAKVDLAFNGRSNAPRLSKLRILRQRAFVWLPIGVALQVLVHYC
jgi:hypothetical protein